jgi:hypothetical protein
MKPFKTHFLSRHQFLVVNQIANLATVKLFFFHAIWKLSIQAKQGGSKFHEKKSSI